MSNVKLPAVLYSHTTSVCYVDCAWFSSDCRSPGSGVGPGPDPDPGPGPGPGLGLSPGPVWGVAPAAGAEGGGEWRAEQVKTLSQELHNKYHVTEEESVEFYFS